MEKQTDNELVRKINLIEVRHESQTQHDICLQKPSIDPVHEGVDGKGIC